jgi:ABC-type Fe3+-siderophore transport system permease subunit
MNKIQSQSKSGSHHGLDPDVTGTTRDPAASFLLVSAYFLILERSSRLLPRGKGLNRKPKTRLPFPWWCRHIAWAVNIAGVFASIAFVFLYGISWKEEQVAQWLSMVLVSFCTNIFLTSPIKVGQLRSSETLINFSYCEFTLELCVFNFRCLHFL